MRQQEKLGDLNGYIEEMVNGQKVVKVFCHEQKAQEGFDRVNDALFESADMANKYANILMPIMVNIGNIQYVIVAMAGGLMALGGVGGGVTLGVIASFLQLSKSFSQPISQISQQLNSVVMALAGAQSSLSPTACPRCATPTPLWCWTTAVSWSGAAMTI